MDHHELQDLHHGLELKGLHHGLVLEGHHRGLELKDRLHGLEPELPQEMPAEVSCHGVMHQEASLRQPLEPKVLLHGQDMVLLQIPKVQADHLLEAKLMVLQSPKTMATMTDQTSLEYFHSKALVDGVIETSSDRAFVATTAQLYRHDA